MAAQAQAQAPARTQSSGSAPAGKQTAKPADKDADTALKPNLQLVTSPEFARAAKAQQAQQPEKKWYHRNSNIALIVGVASVAICAPLVLLLGYQMSDTSPPGQIEEQQGSALATADQSRSANADILAQKKRHAIAILEDKGAILEDKGAILEDKGAILEDKDAGTVSGNPQSLKQPGLAAVKNTTPSGTSAAPVAGSDANATLATTTARLPTTTSLPSAFASTSLGLPGLSSGLQPVPNKSTAPLNDTSSSDGLSQVAIVAPRPELFAVGSVGTASPSTDAMNGITTTFPAINSPDRADGNQQLSHLPQAVLKPELIGKVGDRIPLTLRFEPYALLPKSSFVMISGLPKNVKLDGGVRRGPGLWIVDAPDVPDAVLELSKTLPGYFEIKAELIGPDGTAISNAKSQLIIEQSKQFVAALSEKPKRLAQPVRAGIAVSSFLSVKSVPLLKITPPESKQRAKPVSTGMQDTASLPAKNDQLSQNSIGTASVSPSASSSGSKDVSAVSSKGDPVQTPDVKSSSITLASRAALVTPPPATPATPASQATSATPAATTPVNNDADNSAPRTVIASPPAVNASAAQSTSETQPRGAEAASAEPAAGQTLAKQEQQAQPKPQDLAVAATDAPVKTPAKIAAKTPADASAPYTTSPATRRVLAMLATKRASRARAMAIAAGRSTLTKQSAVQAPDAVQAPVAVPSPQTRIAQANSAPRAAEAVKPATTTEVVMPHARSLALIKRGQKRIAIGDIALARLLFERAARGGSADAAFFLAETYDPNRIWFMGSIGLTGNPQIARKWYIRARQLDPNVKISDRLKALAGQKQ